MWLDEEGIVHTVDTPGAESMIDPGVRGVIDRATPRNKEQLAVALQKLQNAYYDDLESGRIRPGADEAEYSGLPYPGTVGSPEIQSLRQMLEYLSSMDDRWRLDAVLIVSGYLEQLLDDV